MKIAVISPNPRHILEIGTVLEGSGHVVTSLEGPKNRITQVVDAHRPDLILLDGMCCDLSELDSVEQVTTLYPQLMVVLLCSQQTSDFLIKAMRVGVREVLPSPVPPAALLSAVSRLDGCIKGGSAPARGQLLAFMPCKGGSGATFIASNLGYQLAQGKSVLLIDLNLQFGDALSLLHDQEPTFTLSDVARDIHRLDAAFLAASTVKITPHFSVLAAPQDFGDAVDIKPEHVDAILQLAVKHHDFVLLDLGRHLDHMNIKALDRADHIFVVLQAGLPWLRHAKRLQQLFRSLEYPPDKVQWLVNRYERSADIGLEEIGRALETPRLRTVVNSYRDVKTAVNHGTALVELMSASAVTRSLAELALSLSPRQEEPRSLLGRLFRRA